MHRQLEGAMPTNKYATSWNHMSTRLLRSEMVKTNDDVGIVGLYRTYSKQPNFGNCTPTKPTRRDKQCNPAWAGTAGHAQQRSHGDSPPRTTYMIHLLEHMELGARSKRAYEDLCLQRHDMRAVAAHVSPHAHTLVHT